MFQVLIVRSKHFRSFMELIPTFHQLFSTTASVYAALNRISRAEPLSLFGGLGGIAKKTMNAAPGEQQSSQRVSPKVARRWQRAARAVLDQLQAEAEAEVDAEANGGNMVVLKKWAHLVRALINEMKEHRKLQHARRYSMQRASEFAAMQQTGASIESGEKDKERRGTLITARKYTIRGQRRESTILAQSAPTEEEVEAAIRKKEAEEHERRRSMLQRRSTNAAANTTENQMADGKPTIHEKISTSQLEQVGDRKMSTTFSGRLAQVLFM